MMGTKLSINCVLVFMSFAFRELKQRIFKPSSHRRVNENKTGPFVVCLASEWHLKDTRYTSV